MALQPVSTATIGMSGGIKCLVYGNAGVGKTRLLASAPAPIIISAERGLLSLRHVNLPALQIDSLAKLMEAYKYVTGPNGRQFQTICLDSISEIAEVCLTEEKRKSRDGRKAYGEMQEQMVDIFRSFRDIPGKNVVFLAKQEFVKDGQSGGMYNRPNFPGQNLAQAAPYMFDEVWQLVTWRDLTTQQPYWGLVTQPDANNVAKDRSGVLSPLENADPATGGGLAYLFNKMLTTPAS